MSAAQKPDIPAIPEATKAEIVERYNEHYAIVLVGSAPMVLREGVGSDGREELRLLAVNGFHDWNCTDLVWLIGNDDQKSKKAVHASKIWFNALERRRYEGLVFDPSETSKESYYNLWRGFPIEPAPPGSPASCQRFLDHIAENVCDGSPELFSWVMGWFAAMFQKPTQKLGTSLVLRGSQGSGKTMVGRHIGSLLGDHYALVADSHRIVGRFNSHLANVLLLQLDEATWGGDHHAAGKLKDLITGDYQMIEYKGREPVKVKNYVRLLVTGNNSWLVPAGLEERRFCVLDVADHKRQNIRYFQAIEDELDHGGREALLRYLLDFDLTDIPLNVIPQTDALVEQKISSLSSEQHWWLDILQRGAIPGDTAGEGVTESDELYSHYLAQMNRTGVTRKMSDTAFGVALHRLVKGVIKKRLSFATPTGYRRPYGYVFPQLTECRKEFDRVLGRDGDRWGEAVDTWQPDERERHTTGKSA